MEVGDVGKDALAFAPTGHVSCGSIGRSSARLPSCGPLETLGRADRFARRLYHNVLSAVMHHVFTLFRFSRVRARHVRLIGVLFSALYIQPVVAQAVTDWEVLAEVSLVEQGIMFVPSFGEPVQALSNREVRLRGFMLPLEEAPRQQHFILSANPVQNCFFCLPGGPESMVEVKLREAVDFKYDPIVVRGKLELLTDDPMGMYYRMEGASLE